jgi:hypothetical protein
MTNAEQIKNIESLRGAALREKFHEVVGTETRSKDRPYLIKKIVQALQARAETAPETVTRARTKKTPPTKTPAARSGEKKRERDARLPAPGTVLEREHDGKTVRVKVLEDGFEFRGKTYRSLSAVAREVTQTAWNGLLFFHLIPYAKRSKKAA